MDHTMRVAEHGDAFDLVVVGAGAAGLWAAIHAGEAGAPRFGRETSGDGVAAGGAPAGRAGLRIAVLDSRSRVGAKILMSGGTRCNVTHAEVRPEDYRGASPRRIAHFLRAHPVSETVRVFERMGVSLKNEGGKLFPADDQARTILKALLEGIERAGAKLITGRRVVGIEPSPSNPASISGSSASFRSSIDPTEAANPGQAEAPVPPWKILSVDEQGAPLPPLLARRVILATGGCSYPRSGSDGALWPILRGLGHTVVPPVPALSPLLLEGGFHLPLAGITHPAELTLREDGSVAARTQGSLLWTHFGVSGPAALDLSGFWARARCDRPRAALQVTASFLPGRSFEELEHSWIEKAVRQPAETIQGHHADLPRRLVQALALRSGLDASARLAQTAREARRAFLNLCLQFLLPVVGTAGFNKAEVTSGGIPLEEVDDGLESKVLQGLHLAGEMLHVDGRLGGFNFQWAWSSGAVAGTAAARRLSPAA